MGVKKTIDIQLLIISSLPFIPSDSAELAAGHPGRERGVRMNTSSQLLSVLNGLRKAYGQSGPPLHRSLRAIINVLSTVERAMLISLVTAPLTDCSFVTDSHRIRL